MSNQSTRASTSLRLLCEVAQAHGVSASDCLSGTGIALAELDDPKALHTTEQEVVAIENLVQLVPNGVGLGVEIAQRMHVNAFGIWGFAILTSPTLRSAIDVSIRFVKLSFLIADMSLEEEQGRGRLVFDMAGLPAPIHTFIAERHTMVAVNFFKELIGESGYLEFQIETKVDRHEYARRLTGMTGIEVVASAPAYAVSFSADLLDRPLPKSDPASLRFCFDQCKALLQQNEGALPPWSNKVRDTIVDNIRSQQKIEDVADVLSVTERTLRRRLTEEGTSFRELYIDARMAIAHELLESAGLNVETVSWRVRYAEPASFVRAFSKKYGKTPGDVRRSRIPSTAQTTS